MPREARIDYPGALQHVCLRGIERRTIFHDDDDRERFLAYLEKALHEAGNPCLAWALMPNHVHLLLETRGAPLARVMRRLGTRYALAFNRRHGRAGHLFQNRYFSKPVESDDYVVTAACYILRNPLRAGIVPTLRELETYPWTAYPALLGRGRRAFEDVDGLLRALGGRPDQARVQLRARMAEAEVPPEAWAVPLADIPEVANARGREGARVSRNPGLPTPKELRERGWSPDRLIEEVSRSLGIEEADLRAGRRLAEVSRARALVAYLGHEHLGYPFEVLGRATGVGGMAMALAVGRGRSLAMEQGILIPYGECEAPAASRRE